MWRVHGFVGRVLSRCHGNTPLRLSNGYHVEDEVISSSGVLSTGHHGTENCSHRDEQGEQKKKRRTSQFCHASLPRYTALDAVGWGAAAVLFMQICRRIHSQFSLGEQNVAPARLSKSGLVRKCTYRVLLDIISKRDILPRGVNVKCLKAALPSPEQDVSGNSVHSYSSGTDVEEDVHQQEQEQELCHNITEETQPDLDLPGAASASAVFHGPQEKKPCSLEEAERNLRETADSSVPVILNIIGLESAKAGNYKAAFECFLASAQQHYSKAQYNVGVCYEKGQGVEGDFKKALHFYKLAAAAGHKQAQYRGAKLLLNSRGQQSETEAEEAASTALALLHTASASGLTEAQLYLGVLYSQDSDDDSGEKAVQFFRMAADSGDSTGLLFLAQCYERGFGVAQSYSTALGLYQQAADKGNKQAKNVLKNLHSRGVLPSIRSAPCLSVLDQLRLSVMYPQVFKETGSSKKQQDDWPLQPLPHSWSTGNLQALSQFSAQTISAKGKSGGWIIGMG